MFYHGHFMTDSQVLAYLYPIVNNYLDEVYKHGYDITHEPLLKQIRARVIEMVDMAQKPVFDEDEFEWYVKNFLWTLGFQREFYAIYKFCGNPAEYESLPSCILWNDSLERPLLELFIPRVYSG